MIRIVSIKKWPGLIESADTRDVPFASIVSNADVTSKIGSLVAPKGYEKITALDFSSTTLKQFLEFLSPQHADGVKVFIIRRTTGEISFSLDTSDGFRTPVNHNYQKKYIKVTGSVGSSVVTETNVNAIIGESISLVEKNGIVYGGVGVGDDEFPFIFLLTDYKRFEDFDNLGTWFNDYSLENATDPEDSYHLDVSELEPPTDNNVDLTNIGHSVQADFTAQNYALWPADTVYHFYYTFTYDGFQESSFYNIRELQNLEDIRHEASDRRGAIRNLPPSAREINAMAAMLGEDLIAVGAADNAISFNIDIVPSKIPRRVTGLNIYMRLIGGLNSARFERSELRLVKTIPFDDRQLQIGRIAADLAEESIEGFTTAWDDQGSDIWRFIERPRNSSTIYLSFYDFQFGKPWAASLPYIATTQISPKYKYNHLFKNSMYVGPVSYPVDKNESTTEWEYFSNMFIRSVAGSYSILPFTNRNLVLGEITAINSLADFLLIFTLNDLFIFDGDVLIDTKENIGCYSNDSVVGHSNQKYWASKNGFVRFNGYKAEIISDYFVSNSYLSLTENSRKSMSGEYLPELQQIIWTPSFGVGNIESGSTFVYNLKDDTWAIRDYGFGYIRKNTQLEVYGDDGQFIYTLNKTQLNGSLEFTSIYQIENIDGGQPEIVKTATVGYIKYKSIATVTLTFHNLSGVLDTITLASTSGVFVLKQFPVSFNSESITARITALGTSEYEIDFIDIWGEVNSIMGEK